VQAQNTYHDWTGGTSDSWTNVLNWSGGYPTGVDATARIYDSSPDVLNNTVLYTGNSASLQRIWLGDNTDAARSGNLTVQSGASVHTTGNFDVRQSSVLDSSGAITADLGLKAQHSSQITINSGGTVAGGMIGEDDSTITLNGNLTSGEFRADNNTDATIGGAVTANVLMRNNATATLQSGSSVGTGVKVQNTAELTTVSGSTINGGLTLEGSNAATVDGDVNGGALLKNSASATFGGVITGNLEVQSAASATLNGTLDGGNITLNGTEMSYIGASGLVDGGQVQIGTGDQLTIAGEVSGAGNQLSVNGSGKLVIESTAQLYSDNENSWLYNDADVTWNVGANGSIGTLFTSRNESAAGAYDGQWRYAGSTNLTVVLDAYDFATYGTNVSLQLVSNIQSENTFADNVTFLLGGEAVDTFTYDANGTFTGSVIPEPTTIGLFGFCALAGLVVRRFRI